MSQATPPQNAAKKVYVHGPRPTGNSATFVNHRDSYQMITSFLADPAVKVVTILGRGGIGKTRLSAYVFNTMEKEGEAADDSGPVTHIFCIGQSEYSVDLIIDELYKGVDEDTQKIFKNLRETHKNDTRMQVRQILNALRGKGRYIIFIGNAEHLLTGSGGFAHSTLEDFFEECMDNDSDVSLLLASRILFNLSKPVHTSIVDIENKNKLAIEHGIQIVLQMIEDRHMHRFDRERVSRIVERVGNIPRALEIIGKIINDRRDATPYATLDILLQGANDPNNVDDAEEPDDIDVVEEPDETDESDVVKKPKASNKLLNVLIHKNYESCGDDAKQVMRAMAVYKRPVSIAALQKMLNEEGMINPINVQAGLDELQDRTTVDEVTDDGTTERRFVLKSIDQEWVYKFLKHNEHDLLLTWEIRAAEYYLARHPKDIKSIKDTKAMQFAISHFIDAEAYEDALDSLCNIDYDYLVPWGDYATVYNFYQQLEPHIKDEEEALIQQMLGENSHCLGRAKDAITYYKAALKLARANHLSRREAASLNGLGIVEGELGQSQQALERFEKALPIAETLGNPEFLGKIHANMGQELMRLDRFSEVAHQLEQAMNLLKKGSDKATVLAHQAHFMLLEGDMSGALEKGDEGMRKASRYGYEGRGAQSHCGLYLALAQLRLGDIKSAYKTLTKIEKFPEPANSHNILVLLGIVALQRGEAKAAKTFFQRVIQMLKDVQDNRPGEKPLYDMLFAVALAQSGLLLCDAKQSRRAAETACKRALDYVGSAKGIVKTARMLFDELAKNDTAGILDPIRLLLEGAS